MRYYSFPAVIVTQPLLGHIMNNMQKDTLDVKEHKVLSLHLREWRADSVANLNSLMVKVLQYGVAAVCSYDVAVETTLTIRVAVYNC